MIVACRRLLVALTALLALPSSAGDGSAPEGFVEVPAHAVQWRPHPAVKGAEYAILLGRPDEAQPLVVRIKFPPRARVPPHTHLDARSYTVLAGQWQLGFGREFDTTRLITYEAGSFYRLPAGTPHFQMSGDAGAIIQIESMGPTGTRFFEQ